MKLTVLGNCATQTIEHETTSFVLSEGKSHLLIDCGPAVVRQLLLAGIHPKNIAAIIITHCHGDHTAGFPYFLFMVNLARSMQQNTAFDKIPVLALSAVMVGLKQLQTIQYPVEKLWDILICENEVIKEEANFVVGPFSIDTFYTKHTVPSMGISVKCKDKVITFSSDTIYSLSVEQHAKDAQVLVHEAFCTEQQKQLAINSGHSTAREAGIAAKNASVEKLVLTHPLEFMWQNTKAIIDEAKSVFAGDVILPKDLDTLDI